MRLANLGLIDEYSIVVVPVILGAGKPLFKDVKKTNLKLLEAKSFKIGLSCLITDLPRSDRGLARIENLPPEKTTKARDSRMINWRPDK